MNAMRALRGAILLALLGVAGCAPAGPPFASVAIAPVPPGMARVYLYRWLEPYESVAETTAYFNGQPVGITETGSVLYRDVAPGQYTITVDSWGSYPNQFKTVTMRAGKSAYARIESLKSWAPCGSGEGAAGGGGSEGCWDTFVVQIVDPAVARDEIRDLRFVSG